MQLKPITTQKKPSNWFSPPVQNHNLQESIHRMKCNITLNYSSNRQKFRTYNLSYKESKLLQNLKNNHDLILKLEDKGSIVVIVGETDCVSEVNSRIQNTKKLQKLPFDPTLQIANDISTFILYSKLFIS